MMLALLAFEVTIYRHQELYRLRRNKIPPSTRTLFHDVTRHHLDDSVLNSIKYFLNYFFYKFGLEVSGSYINIATGLSLPVDRNTDCLLLRLVFCWL